MFCGETLRNACSDRGPAHSSCQNFSVGRLRWTSIAGHVGDTSMCQLTHRAVAIRAPSNSGGALHTWPLAWQSAHVCRWGTYSVYPARSKHYSWWTICTRRVWGDQASKPASRWGISERSRCQVWVYSSRGSGLVRTKADEGQGQRAGQEVSLAGVGDRLDSTTKDNEHWSLA